MTDVQRTACKTRHDGRSSAQVRRARQVAERLDACSFCSVHLGSHCPSCRSRAFHVFDAIQQGATIAQAARALRLTTRFADELLSEEEYRRSLAAAAVPKVSNAALRRAAQDQVSFGTSTYSEIARTGGWAGPADVRRLLGLQETSDTRANGRTYQGRALTTITADAAGRLARALGFAPVDADAPDAPLQRRSVP